MTRGLAAALRLAGGFEGLRYHHALACWHDASARAGVEDAVIHDLRHTHASRLIAAGCDPVEIAARLGDRVETILRTYVHEFDARRRGAERRALLEQLYGAATGVKQVPGLSRAAGRRWPSDGPQNRGNGH